MRTTIDINEKLLKTVIGLSEASTKKEAVELSLEAFIHQKRIERLTKRLNQGTILLSRHDLHRMRSR